MRLVVTAAVSSLAVATAPTRRPPAKTDSAANDNMALAMKL
jgi:hypothetical protein